MKVLDGKLRLFDLDQIDSSCDGSHICDVGVKILRKAFSCDTGHRRRSQGAKRFYRESGGNHVIALPRQRKSRIQSPRLQFYSCSCLYGASRRCRQRNFYAGTRGCWSLLDKYVYSQPGHRWLKEGMSKDQLQEIQEFYRQRYGDQNEIK